MLKQVVHLILQPFLSSNILPSTHTACLGTCDTRINIDYKTRNGSSLTALSAAQGSMSSSSRHVISQCFMLVFPKLPSSNGRFRKSEIRDVLEN